MRYILILFFLTTFVSAQESFDDSFDDGFDDEFTLPVKERSDPLRGYNRAMTNFNDSFYRNVFFPAARGYNAVMPKPVRESIDNFFKNLGYPLRLINNLLQLKFKNSLIESERFLLNSTVGILGLFDPAYYWYDLKEKDEDLGQTLGFYGVGSGIPIVLPLVGPSNVRDSLSMLLEWQVDPLSYSGYNEYQGNKETTKTVLISAGISSFKYFNRYSSSEKEYNAITKDAVDKYILLRNMYEQKRNKDIEE
jgi:phospholipid-binding lipoprotein MlaA